MNGSDISATMETISKIHAVEGFDPAPLAVDYTDMNTGETRKRLPVMAQIAWFRLKFPEGRIAISVRPENGVFVATAKIYAHYSNPTDQYLSEATASRSYRQDKPTVSPREWAQTAAVGIALRNAGFGLGFHAAGDGFDCPADDELGQFADAAGRSEPRENAQSSGGGAVRPQEDAEPPEADGESPLRMESDTLGQVAVIEENPLDKAMKLPCPISKYSGRTLGDMIALDPKALAWVANKFTNDPAVAAGAKLICEHALSVSA
jgi:hypothetical protein